MRAMHCNPSEVKQLKIGDVYGSDNGSVKLLNYPKESFGAGTGTHTHFDFTSRLPYDNNYSRQFVDPVTLKAGALFTYSYWYKDKDIKLIADKSGYFARY